MVPLAAVVYNPNSFFSSQTTKRLARGTPFAAPLGLNGSDPSQLVLERLPGYAISPLPADNNMMTTATSREGRAQKERKALVV